MRGLSQRSVAQCAGGGQIDPAHPKAGAVSRETMQEIFRKGEILPDGLSVQDNGEFVAASRNGKQPEK